MYVAVSRVTKANGIHIISEFEPSKTPLKNDPLAAQHERYKKSAYQFLHNRDDFTRIQFIFYNVEVFKTHYEDLLENPCFTQNDIILLAETHTISK